MKCTDCKNFKVQETVVKNDNADKTAGTCAINNTVCDPGDECKTGLFDKMSAI
ncbi:MAG TPA: hypothetical protein VD757_00960 [Candidatus Nitrosocosmicus sp.]|nr:hypothetical protein [Candidatus Nitrosocosmicus sp.]